MKLTLILSALSLSPIIAQTEPAQAVDKPTTVEPAITEKKNANSITFEITDQIKAIFKASATATDEEKANIAIKSINESTEKILALKTVLEATEKPTTAEKKQCAKQMLTFETEVSDILKQMSQTFQSNSEEINKLIEPSISGSKKEIAPAIALINDYYPREEMIGYIKVLKENQ